MERLIEMRKLEGASMAADLLSNCRQIGGPFEKRLKVKLRKWCINIASGLTEKNQRIVE